MKNYAILLSGDELNVIGSALGKMPYEVAAPIFDKIRPQVEAQDRQDAEYIEAKPAGDGLEEHN